MSLIKEFRDTENALNTQLKHMETLKKDATLIKDLEFEKKLEALMKRYSKKMEDLLAFLQPTPSLSGTRTQEKRAVYKTTPNKAGTKKKAGR